LSALEDRFTEYREARAAVLEARRNITAADVEIENAAQRLEELAHVRDERIAEARKAVARFVEVANQLPPLVHSEVAGIAGKPETLARDEAAQ
jgi:phosphoribosylformylglycinamidine (FGAM) synthase-like enzyme